MTFKDPVTELITGREGSISVCGKIVITPCTKKICGHPTSSIAGHIVHPQLLVSEESKDLRELWECELIIIPRIKFSAIGEDGKPNHFAGYTTDGIMTTAGFDSPDYWGRKYFDVTKLL
jgi:hypothetical protein